LELVYAAREINDQHWQDRAAEMRVLSETMKDHETKLIMLRLANAGKADSAQTRLDACV
jgi:hypothetical protein